MYWEKTVIGESVRRKSLIRFDTFVFMKSKEERKNKTIVVTLLYISIIYEFIKY